jgi:tetratricopeptide (TPR) repeat protein
MWLFAAVLLAAVVVTYRPAWHGGFIWDDDEVITAPELQSWHGMYRIWFEPGFTRQQYYPLTFSVLWFERKLFGDTMLGYHLVNLALHVVAALLVCRILQRLAIPGAFLATALFALHPVQVESVAWIVELKNILSTIFYLGAGLLYLRFDSTRECGSYAAAWGLFTASLLCKTSTLTLPAALLLVFWWQRGRLSFRRDVYPLLPFFVMGVLSGLMTLAVEGEPLLETTLWQRFLLPGRAAWFYLVTLFWPFQLVPIYPRWNLDAALWRQVLPSIGILALASLLWWLCRWTRGPLAALLFFLGSLFPVLGFFYPAYFDHSFVADHFVYLPSVGIFAAVASGTALGLQRLGRWHATTGRVACSMVVLLLAALSWHHSHAFTGIEAHSLATLRYNPGCYAALCNLASVLTQRGEFLEAAARCREAIAVMPQVAALHVNLGAALYGAGQKENALDAYTEALLLEPDNAVAHHSLGKVLVDVGRNAEALEHFTRAVELRPDIAEYQNTVGVLLLASGRDAESIQHFRKALELQPQYAEAHYNFGMALAKCGRPIDAVPRFKKALELEPAHPKARYDLALALNATGQTEAAITQYQKALEANPGFVEAMNNLSGIFFHEGRLDEAIQWLRKALDAKPDYQGAKRNLAVVEAEREKIIKTLAAWREKLRETPDSVTLLNDTAWMLATNPNASIRNGAQALELAQRAVTLTQGRNPEILGTLAAAYAETDQFSKAVQTARMAEASATQQGLDSLADLLRSCTRLYEARSPFRQTPQPATN